VWGPNLKSYLTNNCYDFVFR